MNSSRPCQTPTFLTHPTTRTYSLRRLCGSIIIIPAIFKSFYHMNINRCCFGEISSTTGADIVFGMEVCVQRNKESLCGLHYRSVWSLSEICQESQWKKNLATFFGNNPLLSLEHRPLWLTWAWWPCLIPFHQHSGQCEQKTGVLIRDAQMGRSWWQTVSCPSSSMRPLCFAQSMGIHATWGGQYR